MSDDAYSINDSETLLRRAIDIIATARTIPLSSSPMINRDEILELLEEALNRLPDELKQQALIGLLRGKHVQAQESLTTLIDVWQSSRFSAMTQATWCEALHICANRPRRELLEYLTILMPLAIHLGGADTMRELLAALRDTAQWWP